MKDFLFWQNRNTDFPLFYCCDIVSVEINVNCQNHIENSQLISALKRQNILVVTKYFQIINLKNAQLSQNDTSRLFSTVKMLFCLFVWEKQLFFQ